jgi:hypothetical protein
VRNDLPMGSWPGQIFLAKVSLTITAETGNRFGKFAARDERTPTVVKYPLDHIVDGGLAGFIVVDRPRA